MNGIPVNLKMIDDARKQINIPATVIVNPLTRHDLRLCIPTPTNRAPITVPKIAKAMLSKFEFV